MGSSSASVSLKIISRCVFILLLSLSGAVRPVNSIPEREFHSMLGALRARGYHLFSNAITTSDLHLQLISDSLSPQIAHGNNTHPRFFTLFAPTNSALFALGMTQTASSYTDTLRLHIVPRRLTLSGLRSHPSLPTLLPSLSLHVTTRLSSRHRRRSTRLIVSVNNIDVVFPGLYYGRYVAVHGLSGALSLVLQSPLPHATRFRHPDHSSTRRPRRFLLPVNRTTLSLDPDFALNNGTSHTDFPEANRTTPESEGMHRYSPAETTGDLGILLPEDHIPTEHSRSIRVSLLETGNGDHGHESPSEAPSPSMDVLEDGMIMGEKLWLLEEQTEDYMITDSG